MEIDENVETVLARHSTQIGEVVEIVGVEFAGAAMFDRFPSRQQPQAIEAPRSKPSEMFDGFRDREWASDERHFAMIGKIAGKIGAAIGMRNFAVAAQIHAAKQYAPSRLIDEPSSFEVQS
jgi:hypothetical protein